MNAFTRFFALIAAFFTMLFAPSSPVEKKTDVTVMTYNILCDDLTDERLDAVVQQIRAVKPDSFGCQEVKDYSKIYLQDVLKEYDSFCVSDESSNVTYNTLFWLKSKFKKLDQGYVFLSLTPSKPSTGWDAAHRRTLQWVLLEDIKTGCRFVHANTHIDYAETAGKESMKLIEKYLGSFEYPVIVSGDFNSRYTGEAIKSLKEMGWKNTMNMCGINSSKDTYHGYTGEDANHSPIDHIFVKDIDSAKNWKIHKEMYNGMYPSDHFALSVELHLSYFITAKENYELIKNS